MRCRLPIAMLVTVSAVLAGPAVAEVAQKDGIRVRFAGELGSKRLPRQGTAPVTVSLSAKISAASGRPVPQLRRIAIAINRYATIDRAGLPVCHTYDIQPSTSAKALQACRGALVGQGRFRASILLSEQAPFPSEGKILAFNGTFEGRPAILAHVYGTDPAPTSFTLPFVIARSKGTFATELTASLPRVTADWGYVTGLEMTLGKRYREGGRTRGYILAGCPAPAGFPAAAFPLAKATFGFAGASLGSTLTRTCFAR